MSDTIAAPSRRSSPRAPLPVALRVVLALVTAALVFAGVVLIVGQLLPGSNNVKIGLAVVWFFAAGAVLQRLAKGRPELKLPMRAAVLLAAVALGGLYLNSLRGKDVQETLVSAPPAAAPAAPPAEAEAPASSGSKPAEKPAPPAGPVRVAAGSFAPLQHNGSGEAEIIRATGGGLSLQLRDFQTDGGPDLRVYLSKDDSDGDFVDLGALKGNSGNQRYDVPAGTDTGKLDTVLIWCRAFSVPYTAAPLSTS